MSDPLDHIIITRPSDPNNLDDITETLRLLFYILSMDLGLGDTSVEWEHCPDEPENIHFRVTYANRTVPKDFKVWCPTDAELAAYKYGYDECEKSYKKYITRMAQDMIKLNSEIDRYEAEAVKASSHKSSKRLLSRKKLIQKAHSTQRAKSMQCINITAAGTYKVTVQLDDKRHTKTFTTLIEAQTWRDGKRNDKPSITDHLTEDQKRILHAAHEIHQSHGLSGDGQTRSEKAGIKALAKWRADRVAQGLPPHLTKIERSAKKRNDSLKKTLARKAKAKKDLEEKGK